MSLILAIHVSQLAVLNGMYSSLLPKLVSSKLNYKTTDSIQHMALCAKAVGWSAIMKRNETEGKIRCC